MWGDIRRALVTVLAASMGLAGLSYAATGHVGPVTSVSENEEVTTPVEETGDEGTEGTEEELADAQDEVVAEAADGPERSTEGCGDGTFENHGAFVSSQEETPRNEAAKSPCGKPVQSIHANDEGDGSGEEPAGEEASEPKKPKKDKGPEAGGGEDGGDEETGDVPVVSSE
jgi:hypothetical protein